MSKIIRLTENDLVRLVKKVIAEQTATSREFPLLPKESEEEAQRRFFNQLGDVIEPMIGSKTKFFRFSNNTRQDIKENKKPGVYWLYEYRIDVSNRLV